MLNEVRFVEDFTPNDFEIRKKALPLIRKAFEEGKRVRFTKGKLFVDGREVSIMWNLINLNTVVLIMIRPNFLSLLPLCSTAKASANVHRVMISCVSHLLAQYCTSANFENNSFAVNCFMYAFFFNGNFADIILLFIYLKVVSLWL